MIEPPVGPFQPTEANMRRAFAKILLPVAFLVVLGVSARAFASDRLVVKWNDALLESVRESRLGPPMVARAIGRPPLGRR